MKRHILLYTTLAFALTSVMSGIFANQFISFEGINTARLSEARWVLITIMPVILMVNFVWLSSTPTKGTINTSLQIIGQAALFVASLFWIFN